VVVAHYKKGDLLNCCTSSLDISGYHADFHEGHGTVGAVLGRGMACVNERTAWARHAMCESAFPGSTHTHTHTHTKSVTIKLSNFSGQCSTYHVLSN